MVFRTRQSTEKYGSEPSVWFEDMTATLTVSAEKAGVHVKSFAFDDTFKDIETLVQVIGLGVEQWKKQTRTEAS
jgi:hypothetical protein